MASFFNLELDTTSPTIEIYAPNYTDIDTLTDIHINANDELSQYQDIYIIDSSNKKYDLIFEHSINEFRGKIRFNNCTLGIATIYARLKDDVDNVSNIVSKPINIIKNQVIRIGGLKREIRNIIHSKSCLKQSNTKSIRRIVHNKNTINERND